MKRILTPLLMGIISVAAGSAALISPRLFWAILAAAVIVLLLLIARLVRKPAA